MFFRKLARTIAARKTAVALAIVAFAIINFSSVTGVFRAQRLAQSGPTSESKVRFRRTGVPERERS